MGTLSLILGLAGGMCAIFGLLTAVELLPTFVQGGELLGPVVFGTIFWWGLAVILLLASIALAIGRRFEHYE